MTLQSILFRTVVTTAAFAFGTQAFARQELGHSNVCNVLNAIAAKAPSDLARIMGSVIASETSTVHVAEGKDQALVLTKQIISGNQELAYVKSASQKQIVSWLTLNRESARKLGLYQENLAAIRRHYSKADLQPVDLEGKLKFSCEMSSITFVQRNGNVSSEIDFKID